MASTHNPMPWRKRLAQRFYLGMSVFLAVVIIAGFAQTYPTAISTDPPLPLWIHLHGVVFASWVLLMVAQPTLVASGAIHTHRTLGWVGAVLASLMVVMGFVAVIVALQEHYIPAFLPRRIFVIGNLLSVMGFGSLVAMGVANRGRPEWHKRLMIGATMLITSQALGRLLPLSLFGDAAPAVLFGVLALLALVGPVVDLIVRGRIHPAYFVGLGVLLAFEILTPVIAFSPLALPVIHVLGG
jgi:hypothetical protein